MKKRTTWSIIVITHILTAIINTYTNMFLYMYHSSEMSDFSTAILQSQYTTYIEYSVYAITFFVAGIVTVKLLKKEKSKYHILTKVFIFTLSCLINYYLIPISILSLWIIASVWMDSNYNNNFLSTRQRDSLLSWNKTKGFCIVKILFCVNTKSNLQT